MPTISGTLLNSGSCRRCHKDGRLETVDILAYMSDKVSQSLGPRGMDKMVWWNSASFIVLPDLKLDPNWKRRNNHCMSSKTETAQKPMRNEV